MSALDSDNPFNPFVLRVEVAPEQLAAHGKPPELLMDEAIDEQILALRLREEELEQRRAEFEADVELREERVERWRAELTELKDLLERRERDLESYVEQLQSRMNADQPGPTRADGHDEDDAGDHSSEGKPRLRRYRIGLGVLTHGRSNGYRTPADDDDY